MKSYRTELEILRIVNLHYPIKKSFIKKILFKKMRIKLIPIVYISKKNCPLNFETKQHIPVKDHAYMDAPNEIQEQTNAKLRHELFQQACRVAVEKFLFEKILQKITAPD